MEENNRKLIEQLAQELGTTSEYLWEILIKQAFIDASIKSISFLAVVIFGIILWNQHKVLIKKDEQGDTPYQNPGISGVMLFFLSLFVVFFILSIFSISDIIIGYCNPEYWALKTIFDKI